MKKIYFEDRKCYRCGKKVCRYRSGHCKSCTNTLSRTGIKMKKWKLSEKTKRKMSLSKIGKPHLWNRGNKSNLWKGGVTDKNLKICNSLKYKNWRRKVFEKDNYTCIWCGQVGGKLNADHIKSFANFPELRFELSNGRTLCKKCHKKTNNYGNKPLRNKNI